MNNLDTITTPNKDLLKILEQHPNMYSVQKCEKGKTIKIKGEIIEHHWYIESGLIKGWDYIREVDRNVIFNFLWEGSFLPLDIHHQLPVSVNSKVVEDVIMYEISEESFNQLKKMHPELEDIVKRNIQGMNSLMREKTILFHYNNATLRYNAMAKQYSFFEKLSPVDAAAFLGYDKKTIENIRK